MLKKFILTETELINLIEDVATIAASLPKLKTSLGYIYINGKKYELQTKKALIRIGIDIIKASINKSGVVTLTIKHPISGKNITSKIKKSNFSKVIAGVKKNSKEIKVKDEEGKEFFLVKA